MVALCLAALGLTAAVNRYYSYSMLLSSTRVYIVMSGLQTAVGDLTISQALGLAKNQLLRGFNNQDGY